MFNFLIAIYVSLFYFLAYRKIDRAVFVLIAFLPSYLIRFKIFGVPFTLLEAMILVIFVVWFVKNYKFIIGNFKNKLFRQRYLRQPEADPPLAEIRLGRTTSCRYPFDVEMILLLVVSFVAVGVSFFSNDALGIWKAYFFEPILLYIVLFNILMTSGGKEEEKDEIEPEKKIEILILRPLAVSAVLVSSLAIYQKITGQFIFNESWAAEATRRVVSFFGYPNAVGLYLGPLILIFTGWLFSIMTKHGDEKRRNNPAKNTKYKIQNTNQSQIFKIIFVVSAILLSFAAILFARSEGAIIGVAAGLLLFGLLAGGKIRRAAIAFSVAFAIAAVVSASGGNAIIKKITLNDFSGQVRRLQWSETWKMLEDGNLFFGSGLAGYKETIAPYHQEGFFYNKDNDPDFRRKIILFDKNYKAKYWQPLEIYLYPHNILFNFWTELGLAGMLLFVWIIVKYFIMGIKSIFNFQFSIFNKFKNLRIKKLFKNYKLSARGGFAFGGEIKNSNENNKYLTIGLLAAMTVIIVHGLVDVPYFKNDLAVMFWILLAMMGAINLKYKEKK